MDQRGGVVLRQVVLFTGGAGASRSDAIALNLGLTGCPVAPQQIEVVERQWACRGERATFPGHLRHGVHEWLHPQDVAEVAGQADPAGGVPHAGAAMPGRRPATSRPSEPEGSNG